jgi:hypothetical protein
MLLLQHGRPFPHAATRSPPRQVLSRGSATHLRALHRTPTQ